MADDGSDTSSADGSSWADVASTALTDLAPMIVGAFQTKSGSNSVVTHQSVPDQPPPPAPPVESSVPFVGGKNKMLLIVLLLIVAFLVWKFVL